MDKVWKVILDRNSLWLNREKFQNTYDLDNDDDNNEDEDEDDDNDDDSDGDNGCDVMWEEVFF